MRFNTLYHGSATEAAAELDGGDVTPRATNEELQAALVNALQCIAALERKVDALEARSPSDFDRWARAVRGS